VRPQRLKTGRGNFGKTPPVAQCTHAATTQADCITKFFRRNGTCGMVLACYDSYMRGDDIIELMLADPLLVTQEAEQLADVVRLPPSDYEPSSREDKSCSLKSPRSKPHSAPRC
jgi:hypothetical protein